MRIEAIYITYNTRIFLAYSSNSNYLETLEIKSIISKNYRDSNKYSYKPRNIKLSILLLIIIMRIAIIRNILRLKLIIFSRENYINRLIPRLNSR